MKFEPNPKVTELVKTLMPLEYGSVVTHESLMTFIGVREKTMKYYSFVRSANKLMTEAGRMMRNLPKLGYEIVAPDEYADAAKSHVRAAARATRRADKICEVAPVESMSKDGVKKFREVNDRIRSLAAMVADKKKEIFLIKNTTAKDQDRTFERLPAPRPTA